MKVFSCNRLLAGSFTFLVIFAFSFSTALAQCVGLPAVAALGSNKLPVGLCSPVNASLTYNVQFAFPVPEGTLELVYDWGDGTPNEVVPWTSGGKVYQAERLHDFPEDSDCEYIVTMTIRYKGKVCTNTRQIQKISSWRTDKYNGGNIGLTSPVTKKGEHLVCEGSDISVIFKDNSVFNCNAQYIQQAPDAIESPNTEGRWQQIVYNTGTVGKKIPNIRVNGELLTDATGNNIISNYQDPRGVFHMATPVVVSDPRRRPSLEITAPGGFGPSFPKAGDVFTITLRYWNFCNPYDDPNIPGPPTDLINGDHPPVENTATIKILAPPTAPGATQETVCNGITPKAFSVTNVPTGNLIRWYENIPNPDRPGALISEGKTLPITSHPEWETNTKAGVYKVWATHQATASSAINCESPKTMVTRTIRETLTIGNPEQPVPAEVCNNSSVTVALPVPANELIGGPTHYSWETPEDVTLKTKTASSADFLVSVKDFGTALFVERTIKVTRQYSNIPGCEISKEFKITVYKTVSGGTLSSVKDVCAGSPVEDITVTGFTGMVKAWEMKQDAGTYQPYTGTSFGTSISPGNLLPGRYSFRALVGNGVCNEAYSNEVQVEVFTKPQDAFAGEDQFICTSLSSASLQASNALPGLGTWSYVASVPKGLPSPTFNTNIHDPNTTITVAAEHAGAYTLRWTVTNGACVTTDEVVVDFGTNPSDPDAGKDKWVCGPNTSLEGNIPQKGLGNWTVVNGPGCVGAGCSVSIVTPTSSTSEVQLTGETPTYGSYTFRWSISSGGNNCFLKTDEVTIRFDEPAEITASDIELVCLDQDDLQSIPLSGSIKGVFAEAKWVNVSGRGTVSQSVKNGSANYVIKAAYIPHIEDYISGKNIQMKLVASPLSSSSCGPVEQIINIKVDRKPVADAGEDINSICEDWVTLNAASPMYGAKGMWTSTQSDIVFDDPSDPKTTVRNLPPAPSKTLVTWTVTSASGMCTSTPSTIQLTRVKLPETKNFTTVACETAAGSTHIQLTAFENSVTPTPAVERKITWFKTAYSSRILVEDPAVIQNVMDGQQYVAVVQDVKTKCTSEAQLTIKVRPAPKVINGLMTLCEDLPGTNRVSGIKLTDPTYTNAVTTEENVAVTWHNTEDDALNNASPISAAIDFVKGKEVYARVAYNQAPYCFSTTKLTLLANPTPSITTIFGRESVCQGNPSALPNDLIVETYQVTPIPGAKYYWEIPNDPNAQFKVFGGGREGDFYVLLQFPNVYTGKIRVRAELNGCSGPVIEKQIEVAPAPVKPAIVGEAIVYNNSQAVSYRVSPDNYPASTYNWEIRRASDNSFGGAYIIEGQSTGNILLNMLTEDVIVSVRENNAMCASPVATKTIDAIQPPKPAELKAAFNATPTASCFPVNIQVTNQSVGADTFIWKLIGADGSITASNLQDPQFMITSPGTYTLHLTATHAATGEFDETQLTGIQVLDVPHAAFNLQQEVVYVPDTELKVLNFSNRAQLYEWRFGDGNTSYDFEPSHAYQEDGTYLVTLLAGIDHGAQDIDGDGTTDGPLVCYDSAQQQVIAKDGGYLDVPNAFTPDQGGPSGGRVSGGGGYNDVFYPMVKGVTSFKMQIYDRWGTMVFESNDPDIGWDGYDKSGTLMTAGVYVYKIAVTLSNGFKDVRMGDVALIR